METGRKTLLRFAVVAFAISIFACSAYAIDPEIVVGIWLFDRGAGDVARDSSGNGHQGQISGDVKWIAGKFGNALEFPGQGPNLVKVTHVDILNLDHFTIVCWVKLEGTGTYQAIVWKEGGGKRNYGINLDNSAGLLQPNFTVGGLAGGGWKGTNCRTPLTDGEWHHLAATYDQKMLIGYIDGISEANGAFTNEPDTNSAPLTIGAASGGGIPVKGIIDDVGLFNEALTVDDINNIMANGLKEVIGVAALEPSGKLSTTWCQIKTQY